MCEVRPALQFEALIETMFSLAADGKTNRKGMQDLLEEFVQICKKHNIVVLSKDTPTVESYQADFSKHVK